MPDLTVKEMGKPNVAGLVANCSSYTEAFSQLGLPAPKAGQLLVNGATPVQPGDQITRDTVVHFNSTIKGALARAIAALAAI
jgi:hypothetical protein